MKGSEGVISTPASLVGATTIKDLPYEIIIKIFANLEMAQLESIRLVCKNWNYIITDKSFWVKVFSLKLGTPAKFPSVTDSPMWIKEYFCRRKLYKKWAKARAIHQSYKLINNEYGNIDFALVNFERNQNLGKLLTFSKRFGSVATCNVVDGKSQGYVPSNLYNKISSFKINWNYLLMGFFNGKIVLKNLSTSGLSSSSSVKFEMDEADEENAPLDPIVAMEMNSPANMDKYRQKVDIISGTFTGKLDLWNSSGHLVKNLHFNETILNVKSDFYKYIIVNTATTLYIIDFHTFKVLQTVPLGFEIEVPRMFQNHYSYYGTTTKEELGHMDVDFGDYNIIVCYRSIIKVFYFHDIENIKSSELKLEEGITIFKSQMQTINPKKVGVCGSHDLNVAGKDGLLYANILSDSSVIVWNVRQYGKLDVQCRIYPIFDKYTPEINFEEGQIAKITTIALNSSIIAIGSYNGFTNIHNVFTGDYIREASVRFPRKFTHMHEELIPINEIKLSDDQMQTNGVIICGDTVQYFQFGEKTKESQNKKGKKFTSKQFRKNSISDELDDYKYELSNLQQQQSLFDKFNGNEYADEDEELSVAIALSRSSLNNTDSDLQLAIQLSEGSAEDLINPELTIPTAPIDIDELGDLDEEEQLRRILELSLVEH